MEGAGARTGPLHHRTDEAMARDQKDPNDETVAGAQRAHRQTTRTRHPQMYGTEPSEAARHAVEVFRAAGARTVLELGAGHGRDALLFSRERVTVNATDFSPAALEQLGPAARKNDIAHRVTTTVHDVRDPLAMAGACVDAVFAPMLLRMALSTAGTSGAFPLTRVAGGVERLDDQAPQMPGACGSATGASTSRSASTPWTSAPCISSTFVSSAVAAPGGRSAQRRTSRRHGCRPPPTGR
ncbi:class I SAM-dependent methyltransferase [Streptomyces sp. NPDC051572]|uniref:class I SAM-dependent methyltransferase n=1 Tax=Streptomyces sp. NPDC051572 TaxID=3155802 RepID=UPI00344BC31D